MIRQKIVLEQVKNERKYELFVDIDSPLGEIYDVLQLMTHEVVEKMQSIAKSQQEQKQQEGQNGEQPS